MKTLSTLNNKYKILSFRERLEEVFREFDKNQILITTSFGSTSALLLHLMSQIRPGHPVHFVNTTYLFPETIRYREKLQRTLDLNIVDILPDPARNRFTKENQTWIHNQDLCCFINKIDPLERFKLNNDIWISGLIGYQNANRQNLRVFEIHEHLLKFHPLIDMTHEDVELYYQIYELPRHELVSHGYQSIGCTHCTVRGSGRNGRWFNSQKTECGLHVDIKKVG